MLQRVKTLLGITGTDKDDLLLCIIENTINEAVSYTHDAGIADNIQAEGLIAEMVVHKYSRLGSEGLSSESYSGLSFSYADYPEHLMNQLKAYRRLRVW